ncbi:MAG: 2-isopropylmalate synthase [Rhodococcus sp.]|nr:2-isopropylmalate synthase [Rhodococcus sp. (in: high G+C Gram-positive bacteria)]
MTTSTASDSTFHTLDAESCFFALTLPRGLREEAAEMSWRQFCDTYAPTGRIRLGSWSAERCGLGQWTYETTFGVGDSIRRATATASGPMSALTGLLYDAGCAIEILGFHQQPFGDRTATLLLCEAGGRTGWAFGLGDDTTESALHAMISAANRLYG